MKTVRVKIYSYSELSKKAKERAHSDWLQLGMYPLGSDNGKTLDAFCDAFPIRCTSWEYGGQGSHATSRWIGEEGLASISGLRLYGSLLNNYFDTLYKGRYYSKTRAQKRKGEHYSYVFRHSAVLIEDNGAPLTGYCLDYDILQPIRDFLKHPDSTTFEELMQECLTAWVKACENDMEAYYSEESFAEESEANEWQYTANGKIFYQAEKAA